MDFEKQHKINVLIYQQRVNRIYDDAIKIAAQMGVHIDADSDFKWDDYPQFKKRVEGMLKKLKKELEANIVNGIQQEWKLANKKNDAIATKKAGSKSDLTEEKQKLYFGHNEDARDAFIERKEKGLNLSARVWKLAEQFKIDTELGISAVMQDGLKNGKSAEELQRKVKQYLNEPNKIFRRRRNKETGELELSKPAQNYHPGRGVYRSSRKNALRLTGTETNMAYRNADYERIKNFDFVLGIKVVTSNNHPTKDICDKLAGIYPKGFRFIGWHPHCRCHTETLLKTEKQMSQERKARREALLNDEPMPKKSNEGEITELPDNFIEWRNENIDAINASKKRGKLPFFLRENLWSIEEKEAPVVTPVVLSEEEVKEQIRQRILQLAKERHSKRTKEQEQAIKDKWEKRKKEIEAKKAKANEAIETAKEYGVDSTNLKELLDKYKLNDIQDEIEKVLEEVEAVKKQEEALSDLIPNVHEWHKTVSLKELSDTYTAVKKKLDSWAYLGLENQAKKLEFEAINFLGGNMNNVQDKYPKTWKVSQEAYLKKLDEVKLKIAVNKIDAELSDIKKWYWSHKKAIKLGKLLTDAFDAISTSSDLTLIQQKAQLVRDEYEKKKAEYAKRTKVGSKEIIFSEDNFTKARKDNAVWDTDNGQMADDTLINEAARVWKSATEDEKNYTFEYTQHFCDVNEPLQGRKYCNHQTKERFTEKVNNITSYIDKADLPKDMWFTRGDDGMKVIESRIKFAGGTMPTDIKDLVGMVMQEGGFMSSASRKGQGFSSREVILNIYAPKGTKAVYIEPFSAFGAGKGRRWSGDERFYYFSREQETLFQRGTKMRITKVYEDKSKIYIDCEVIGQEIKDLSYVRDSDIGY